MASNMQRAIILQEKKRKVMVPVNQNTLLLNYIQRVM